MLFIEQFLLFSYNIYFNILHSIEKNNKRMRSQHFIVKFITHVQQKFWYAWLFEDFLNLGDSFASKLLLFVIEIKSEFFQQHFARSSGLKRILKKKLLLLFAPFSIWIFFFYFPICYSHFRTIFYLIGTLYLL